MHTQRPGGSTHALTGDLGVPPARRAGVRKIMLASAAAATIVLAAAGTAVADGTATRVNLPGRLSVRVPAGWRALRGWLSDVTDPAPRLAVASFPVRLSRHSCECGFPNVIDFPPNGAFVFVWEYLNPTHRELAQSPRRPARVRLSTSDRTVHKTCDGPSDTFAFKDVGRVFQVEVYLGAAVTPALRGEVASLLDSLVVRPNT